MTAPKKTFSLEELSSQTSEVLRSAEDGDVVVKDENGRQFRIQAMAEEQHPLPDFEARWKKMEEMGAEMATPEQTERFFEILASER